MHSSKRFQFKTLAFLLVSFLILGLWGLPYWATKTYHENSPPYNFLIAVHDGYPRDAPILAHYVDFAHNADLSLLWREPIQFPHEAYDGELKRFAPNIYDLSFKNSLFTVHYRYQIDEENQRVIPIFHKTTGWLLWIYALIYLVVATVVITLAQWLRFWWKTSFQSKDD